MFKMFYPDEWLESAFVIDYEKLYEQGYRGLIFDIDNTLVPHGEPATSAAKRLFARLKEIGFECCLLSNNKEPRVQMFNKEIGVHAIHKAGKPMKKGYERAMEKMGTGILNTVFIGDQLFTDVWGAKRLGMHHILVRPLNPKEEIQIVLKRYLEKIVLYCYMKEKQKYTEK